MGGSTAAWDDDDDDDADDPAAAVVPPMCSGNKLPAAPPAGIGAKAVATAMTEKRTATTFIVDVQYCS